MEHLFDGGGGGEHSVIYGNSQLQRLWDAELEIMDVIHDFCAAHGLRYTLAFGTLIGAVRHGGFIPWDDDIDIVMPRQDYNRLIALWDTTAPTGYLLQYKENAPDFEQNFVKIRKDHTAFLQDERERDKAYHKGIFVDIAPCDRAAPGRLSRGLQYFACAVELLYSKEHISGRGGLSGFIERLLLCAPKGMRPLLRRKARACMSRWNDREDLPLFCSDTIENCRRYFPADMLGGYRLVPFQGHFYHAILSPEDFLKVRYGDYMQLPPEAERAWKHHPILIDFEHNYEELTGQQ